MTSRLNSILLLLSYPCFICVSSVAALLFFPKLAAAAESTAPPVTLAEDAASVTLANSHITARIDKRTGGLTSLRFKDIETLDSASGKAGGYWSFDGGGSLGASGESRIILNPAKNGGERAIVSCRFAPRGGVRGLAVDVDMRFALGRDDSGLYVYSIWSHNPELPAFRLAEARYTLKLNPRLFDFMTIDARRRREMLTPEDWNRGEQLNLKEARRLTTGQYKGQVEHKYDYSAVQFDTPAYGWSSSEWRFGLWMVNPSNEYLGGGPTKVELTGHRDAGTVAAPVLCNYWVGSHYGGSDFRIAEGEAWTKVVGPMLVYCNAAGNDAAERGQTSFARATPADSNESLWRDALARAVRESAAWPYDWAASPDYPAKAERGSVAGRIQVVDAQSTQRASNMLVGLTAPGESDWQRDAKSYQFWVRADREGRFNIPNARPGKYTLRAIADGVLGEFDAPAVTVAAGQSHDLGELTWKPIRYGKQLWEIGVPNRSAEEFRHGDDYWHWGLYLKYPEEFLHDVNYIVGQSDWHKDWNYCQPARVEAGRATGTTWSITFPLTGQPHGTATLRLAICGARAPKGIDVSLNDASLGGTGPLPDSGVMHRDGIRGYWLERDLRFDAARLKPGANTLQLHLAAKDWVNGVLYDYLRLELDDATSFAPK